jgi:hypothetical protein
MMARTIAPPYPKGEAGSVTVSVRLAPSEAVILDLIRGEISAGAFLRGCWLDIHKQLGRVERCGSVRALRGLLRQRSSRSLHIIMAPGTYLFDRPPVVASDLEWFCFAAAPPVCFQFNFEPSLFPDTCARFIGCRVEWIGLPGVQVIS